MFRNSRSRRYLLTKKKNKPQKIGKRTVKSPFEYTIWQRLNDLLPKGASVEYESEKFSYTIQHTYTPDYVIRLKDGRLIYIEAKGNGRQFDNNVRQKMIAVKKQYPDMDLRIVFYSDGKIGPKRKDGSFLKQSDWAKKNNFIFAIKDIPEDWFNE